MKKYSIYMLGCIFIFSIFLLQCKDTITSQNDQVTMDRDDTDSDRPPWAGGNKDENPNPKPNPDSGTMRGADYGDLFICLRDANGVPEYVEIEGEKGTIYSVQPIAFQTTGDFDENGDPILILDEEGFPIEAFDPADPEYVFTWVDGDLYHPDLEVAPATVELGRKNIARSPQPVLDRAFNEAMKSLNARETLDIDFCGRLIGMVDDADKTIDSPRENMALYQQFMIHFRDGSSKLTAIATKLDALFELRGVTWMDIAASCFAAASDKSDNLNIDEIMYANTFLKINEKDEYDRIVNYVNFMEFNYNRLRYQNRCISILHVYGDGTWETETLSIADAQNNEYFKFTQKWGAGPWGSAAAFRACADDAIQVLDYLHSDSNIEFLGFDVCN